MQSLLGRQCTTTQCNHDFHQRCLTQWWERGNQTCPLCRTPISRPVPAPGHQRRLRLIAFDQDVDVEEADALPAAAIMMSSSTTAPTAITQANQFAFVDAVLGATVMLGCLGIVPPWTYSCLYCPMIFLAVVNTSEEDYRVGMEFWSARFSHWKRWIDTLRVYIDGLGPDAVLDQVSGANGSNVAPKAPHIWLDPSDSLQLLRVLCEQDVSATFLLLGVQGARAIPHYTPSCQERVVREAGIDGEIGACVVASFQGAADPSAAAVAAAASSAANSAIEDAVAAVAAPRSFPESNDDMPVPGSNDDMPVYRSLSGDNNNAPAYRNLPTRVGINAHDAGAVEEGLDDGEASWWSTLL